MHSTNKQPLSLNCSGDNNHLALFQKGGVDQATLEAIENDILLATQKNSSALALATKDIHGDEKKVVLNMHGHWFPTSDNSQRLGSPSGKWSDVYAGTGVINTSDVNEKQQIQDLSIAEEKVARRIKQLMKTFRFNDSVAEKGEKARIHVGVMAQDVRTAFLQEGLNPNQYALFCEDSWYEDEKGKVYDVSELNSVESNLVKKTKLGIRYNELLAFVIAAV